MSDAATYHDELKRRKFERPFRPFVIATAAGRRYSIDYGFAFAMNAKGFLVIGSDGGRARFDEIAAIEDAAAAGTA